MSEPMSVRIANVSKGLVNRSSSPALSKEVLQGKLDKAVNYWGRTFASYQKESKVIIALKENFRILKVDLTDIIRHVVEINLFNVLVAIHYLPNPQFISLEFDSAMDVKRFVELSAIIDGKQIVILTGNESVKFVKIVVDKLPRDLIDENLPSLLSKWGHITSIKTESLTRPDGKLVFIGQSVIDFTINDCSVLEDLPYFVRVLGVKVFLHIRGRKKICYRCNAHDHLVADCVLRYCVRCRASKPLGHRCLLSFAQALQTSIGSVDAVTSGMFEDDMLSHVPLLPPVDKVLLEKSLKSAHSLFPPLLSSLPLEQSACASSSPICSSVVAQASSIAVSLASEVVPSLALPMAIDLVSNKRSSISGPDPDELASQAILGEGAIALEDKVLPRQVIIKKMKKLPASEDLSLPPQSRKTYSLRSQVVDQQFPSTFNSSPPKLKSDSLGLASEFVTSKSGLAFPGLSAEFP